MKFIFSIFLFTSFLYAEENISFIINQKYICMNLGKIVNNKIVPINDNEETLKYPIRFYINGQKILYTDTKTNNKYIFNEKENLYNNENNVLSLNIQDGTRYMIVMSIKGERKGIPLIYRCSKTDRWSL